MRLCEFAHFTVVRARICMSALYHGCRDKYLITEYFLLDTSKFNKSYETGCGIWREIIYMSAAQNTKQYTRSGRRRPTLWKIRVKLDTTANFRKENFFSLKYRVKLKWIPSLINLFFSIRDFQILHKDIEICIITWMRSQLLNRNFHAFILRTKEVIH